MALFVHAFLRARVLSSKRAVSEDGFKGKRLFVLKNTLP